MTSIESHGALNSDESQDLHVKISDRIALLRQDIESLEALTQPIAPENSIGRVSRMDAINNKSVNEAALRQARIRLAALEKALSQVGEPDFGLCARCKNPIPSARLLLVPESRFCVRCAGR